MVRVFQECFQDPLLAGVLGLAVLIIAVLVVAVVREKLQRRRVRRKHEQRSREATEKNRKALESPGRKPGAPA